jgi:hypothetical protein
LDGNRPRSSVPKATAQAGIRVEIRPPWSRYLHDPLTDFTRRLEAISAVAATAEVALRAQNCEQDADIAQ